MALLIDDGVPNWWWSSLTLTPATRTPGRLGLYLNINLTLYCLVSTERSYILKQTCSWKLQVSLTLWLLRAVPLVHSWYVLLVFWYLLNFCRQWLLCKFLILGNLSTHLFGLVFRHPTSEEMRVGVHRTPPPPSVVLRWDFFKVGTLFFKKQFKNFAQALFVYMFVFIHLLAPFRQLAHSCLGWKSK